MDRGRLTVKLGGLLSFQCADGYLSATGIEGERLHLSSPPLADTGDEALPFFAFNKNVFRIVQTRSQALAAEEVALGGADDDAAPATATRRARQEKNEAPPTRAVDLMGGADITYGQVFSLVHADSGLYVSVAHSQPSLNDPDCVSIVLVREDAAATASCEFIFVSRYKIHSDGDKLSKADEVLIRLAGGPVFLHVSAPPLMERVEDDNAEDIDVLDRTFRRGANLAFQQLPAADAGGGAASAAAAAVSTTLSLPPSRVGSFAISRKALQAMSGEQGDGEEDDAMLRADHRRDAIDGLTRAYLDEVNGCEEGGVSFILGRYDYGTDRANAQRAQQHIARSYIACGVPICLYHREREAFMTTSVSNPRPVKPNALPDLEGGGVAKATLKQRRFQGEMSGVKALQGAQGRIHGGSTLEGEEDWAAAEAAHEADLTAAAAAEQEGQLETGSMRSRATRAALAAARATTTVGLMDVSATRRMPYPVFTNVPEDGPRAADASLLETRSGANSMWIIESEDPSKGGPIRLETLSFRLKHVVTGLYLAVCGTAIDDYFGGDDIDDDNEMENASMAGDGDGEAVLGVSGVSAGTRSLAPARMPRETQLCMVPEPRCRKDIERTLFSFENMFVSDCDWLIEQDCLIIKNTLTGMYVATNTAFTGANVRLELRWQPSVADTVVASYPRESSQRNTLFVYQQSQVLARFRDAFQAAAVDKENYRAARRAAAEGGDAAAKAEVEQWEKDREGWAAASEARRNIPDPDEALLLQHHQERTMNTRQSSGRGGPAAPRRGVAPSYAALHSLVRRCQESLITLIRFVSKMDRTSNVLTAEGLPMPAHQQILYDTRIFRLIFDVILTPFCRLATDPTYIGGAVPPGTAAVPQDGRNSHVFQALLAAAHQRQVLMHYQWDYTNESRPEARADAIRAFLPKLPMTGGVVELDEVMLPMHAELHLVVRLAFRLLRLMIAGRSTLADGWCDYLPYCLEFDGRRLHVVQTMQAMFTDNVNIPLEAVQRVAEHFITATRSIRRASYLGFLGAACTFGFRGIPERQEFIARKLLLEHPDLLSEFSMRDGEVYVTVTPGDEPQALLHFFRTYPDKSMLTYVENQVSLMARLCYDGSTAFCREEVAKKISGEIVLHTLRAYVWTGRECVGVSSRLDVLRSHWVRLAFQCFVVDKIRSPERQLRVTTVLFGSSSLREKADPRYYSGHADDVMTAALKQTTLKLLQANPYFVQDDVGRNVLLRAVVAVWFRLIRFKQYTAEEIQTVLPLFLGLLDGTKDILSADPVVIAQQAQVRREALEAAGKLYAKKPKGGSASAAAAAAAAAAGGERLKMRKEGVHLVRIREMICQSLIAALDNATFRGADEVIVYLHNIYTNPEKLRGMPKPWQEGDGKRQRSGLARYGAAGVRLVERAAATVAGESTALLQGTHEASCCCGLCCSSRSGKKKKKVRADGYEEVDSGHDSEGDEQAEDSNSNSDDDDGASSSDDDGEVFEAARNIAAAADTPFVSASDIRDYLDFLTDRICDHLCPPRIVPLLFDVTRYKSAALTTQAMRLLVQMCIVRRSMAQMILTVNTLPSHEVVRSFDKIHDVAVSLSQSLSGARTFGDEWAGGIGVVVETLLESFEDDMLGRRGKASPEEVQRAADAADRADAEEKRKKGSGGRDGAQAEDTVSALREMYASLSQAAHDGQSFGGAETPIGAAHGGVSPSPSLSTRTSCTSQHLHPHAHPHRSRAQQLWSKIAGATRMLIYSNTIRNRRRALGLSATSTVPMSVVVRAEMMAHWRIHETLLAMLPHVPPTDPAFFQIIKFFYFFTLSDSNATLLREHIQHFIDALQKDTKARAMCLNVIVAVLGTRHNVDDFLTTSLLSAFVRRIHGEAYTKMPDKEFVELLSDKIFSRPTLSVVARRRMLLILREHNTLFVLNRPRPNPTVVEVEFISALVNLVCNICGTTVSVLTLAQRMLPPGSMCRIIIQRFRDNPLGIPVDASLVPRLNGSMRGDGTVATSPSSTSTTSPLLDPSSGAAAAAVPASDARGFKMINPYLRALVALYFTSPEDNIEERQQRQNDWIASEAWWTIVRLIATMMARAAEAIQADQGEVLNGGLDIVMNFRQFFLTTCPIVITAFFMNCYNRTSYTKHRARIIKGAFEELMSAAAVFGREVMTNVNALSLTVEEVVNQRRLLGVLEHIGGRAGYATMSEPSRQCGAAKDTMREWLAAQQKVLHARLIVEQEERKLLGISHVNEDDVGAFDILFREEAVSTRLQHSGGNAGKGLLMSGAAATDHGLTQARAALRAMLRGNSLIPSLRRHSSHVACIVNALLIQSTYRASLRESVKRIVEAMNSQTLSPRTFVGLLNLFYNALDTVLYRHGKAVTLDQVLRALPSHDLVDSGEAPRMAPEWEIAQAGESNTNASIPEDSLAYGLQIVFDSMGMTNVAVALCGIDDDVVTYSAIRLAAAIFEGGNQRVQRSMLSYFTTREEGFFQNARDIMRGTLGWVERVNSEHQYYLLKRGLRGADLRVTAASSNVQLVEGLRPKEKTRPGDGRDSAFIRLSGWGRVRGSRRIKMVGRLFRLLQLFCEGHQVGMQNYIRTQHDNLHSANMVHEAVGLLAELSMYITPANLRVVRQGFELLTEACQGPCRANQEILISYETCWTLSHCLRYVNGTEITIGDPAKDRVNNISNADIGELRTAMSTTALAMIEGLRDEEMYQKMLTQLPLQDIEVEISSVSPALLYRITNDEEYEHHPRAEALFNWLIYVKSVLPFANDLQEKQINEILRRSQLLSQYLGSIEVSRDDGLERVFFRIPQISTSLTQERKDVLLWDVDRTSRATKLADFLHKADEVIFAVEQQHDFVSRVSRYTRFRVDYDPDAGALSRGWQAAKQAYNDYIAPLFFSYEVGHHENVSMVLAILVNIILVIFEGVTFRGTIGQFVQQQEVRLVWLLCFVQTFVCMALCYVDIVVTYPVHLYEMYKEKQRYDSGKAQFNIGMDEVYGGLTRRERVECFLGWFGAQFRIFLFVMAALSWLVSPYFAAFNLMLLIYKISTLRTFITAITANGKQLLLTALLGVIMVYLFSIVGFLVFPGSYEPDSEEPDDVNCRTLSKCFLYILNQGLRAGGGVADVMRPWTWTDRDVVARMTYDMLFFALVTVVFLNILFGIIIDTFGQMRDEKTEKEEDMHGLCFICGLDNDTLEKTGVSGFQTHVKSEHNMWMYLYFMHHLRRKDPNDYTGQESYVNQMIQQNSLRFFPDETCLSLIACGGDGDSDGSDDDSDADDGPDAAGGGDEGKGKGGKKGAGSAPEVLKELVAARDSLNGYLKEISADSARLKAVVQQFELSARGTTVVGGSNNNNGPGGFGGGGGGGSVAHTLAPAQSRASATGSSAGIAEERLRGLEQQLRQATGDSGKYREEARRHKAAARAHEEEIARLRAQLRKEEKEGGAEE